MLTGRLSGNCECRNIFHHASGARDLTKTPEKVTHIIIMSEKLEVEGCLRNKSVKISHTARAAKQVQDQTKMALASALCAPKNASLLRTNCSVPRHGRVGRGRE